jgi:hypothetical protein
MLAARMMDPLLRHWKLVGALLVGVLAANALLVPSSAAGGASLLAITALCGAGAAWALSRWSRELPGWAADLLVCALMLVASATLFAAPWSKGGYSVFDWAPHHANLRHLIDGMREGRVPRWVHSVSTGDASYELYPLLPYYLAARAAILTNAQDLTLVLVRSGIVIHVLMALSTALLARRVVPWPWALVAGLAMLYDRGSVWGSGIDGVLGLGVTHSALANAVWPFVLMALIAALQRPGLGHSVRIWLLTVLAIACHPVAVVNALATAAALLLVALLARDLPARRALFALGHLVLGILMAATIWQPFGERLVMYAVHFAIPAQAGWRTLEHIMQHPLPETSFAPLVFAGYAGLLAGLLSRRAVPTLLASFVGVLFAGLFDQLYLLLDLVPSLETVRFQAVRLAASAKPALYACGLYVLHLTVRSLRPVLSAVTGKPLHAERTRLVVGALIALLALVLVRASVPYSESLTGELRGLAHHNVPDEQGFKKLIAWAREQNQAMRPESFGRLLHEDNRRHYSVYHVNAESGLPTLWVGAVSALFLRERIEDASASSLRRFNVRWVMRLDEAPTLGDARSEQRFGRYIVRELAGWDGRFARVERGAGEAVVTRLEDERIDVELRNTDAPALVALGMGYYPRWQARHEQQGPLPVYAMPATEGGTLQVLAAWLPPGRTSFEPTGSLPSDGKGLFATVLATMLALAIAVVWSWRRARWRVLRALGKGVRWLEPRARVLGLAGAVAVTLALVIAGIVSARAPLSALQVGNGLRGAASVEARTPGGTWRRCSYSAVRGAYRCARLALVQDELGDLLNDAPPSPPFAVPVVTITPLTDRVEVRIGLEGHMRGEYWAATNEGKVELELPGQAALTVTQRQSAHRFSDDAAGQLTLRATVAKRALQIALVRRDRIEPSRDYPAPPTAPPAP